MLEPLTRLDPPQLMFLTVMGGLLVGAFTILGSVLAVQVRRLRQKELELGFKDELLLRGYSVDDAIRLSAASTPRWSQGVIDLGNWFGARLSRPIHSLWSVAGVAFRDGSRRLRRLWTRARPALEEWCSRSLPRLQAGISHIGAAAGWLGTRTEALLRKLATGQP